MIGGAGPEEVGGRVPGAAPRVPRFRRVPPRCTCSAARATAARRSASVASSERSILFPPGRLRASNGLRPAGVPLRRPGAAPRRPGWPRSSVRGGGSRGRSAARRAWGARRGWEWSQRSGALAAGKGVVRVSARRGGGDRATVVVIRGAGPTRGASPGRRSGTPAGRSPLLARRRLAWYSRQVARASVAGVRRSGAREPPSTCNGGEPAESEGPAEPPRGRACPGSPGPACCFDEGLRAAPRGRACPGSPGPVCCRDERACGLLRREG